MSNQFCPVCGYQAALRPSFDIMDSTAKQFFTIFECASCGVKKTEPVPEDLKALNATDGQIIPKYKKLREVLINREISMMVKFTNSNKFLEVGPGEGLLSECLFKSGYSIIAADCWKERPYYVRDKLEIPYIGFDYEEMNISDPSVVAGRTVVMRHVLEHLRDPVAFIKKFISQGAEYFFVCVPNSSSFERKVFKRYDSLWCIPCHIWHFDKRLLNALFKRLGLKVVSFGYETTPSVGWHVRRYLSIKKYPKLTLSIFSHWVAFMVSFLLYPFFRNNVIWAVVKVER